MSTIKAHNRWKGVRWKCHGQSGDSVFAFRLLGREKLGGGSRLRLTSPPSSSSNVCSFSRTKLGQGVFAVWHIYINAVFRGLIATLKFNSVCSKTVKVFLLF